MSGPNFEIECDSENGLLTITVHDLPEDWSYREEYGRLVIYVPILDESKKEPNE